jgi:hypothetical protein
MIKFRSCVGLDRRSLALLRVALSLLLCYDAWQRLDDVFAHYSSKGVLPVNVAMRTLNANTFSLFYVNSTWYFAVALFLLLVCMSLVLLVGYRTKSATLACWLLLVSVHNRNALLNDAGDDLLRLVTFWSIFLPLGSAYSIDALLVQCAEVDCELAACRRRDSGNDLATSSSSSSSSASDDDQDACNVAVDANDDESMRRRSKIVYFEDGGEFEDESADDDERRWLYASSCSLVFLLQLALVYWSTALLRNSAPEWQDGTAFYYALSFDQVTRSLGYLLLHYPALLGALSLLWPWLELLVPFAAMSPLWTGPLRCAAALTIVCMQALLALCVHSGTYFAASLLFAIALVPSGAWHRLCALRWRQRWHGRRSVAIVYVRALESSSSSAAAWLRYFALPHCVARLAFVVVDNDDDGDDDGSELSRSLERHWLVVDAFDGAKAKGHGRHRMLRDFEALRFLIGLSPLAWPLGSLALLRSAQRMCALLACACSRVAAAWRSNGTPLFDMRLVAQSARHRRLHRRWRAHRRRRRGGANKSSLESLMAQTRSATTMRQLYADTTLQVLSVLLFCYCCLWTAVELRAASMPAMLEPIGPLLRIDQFWGAVAPQPMHDDGWFVMPAELANTKVVDLFRHDGRSVSYEKPDDVASLYTNQRWRNYYANIYLGIHQDKRLALGRYLCRQWNTVERNRGTDYELSSFKIVYMLEETLSDFRVRKADQLVLWEHRCI